ncbi:MAG: TIM-barrel domain-containing protein [Spirochaetia bacterium]
MTEGTSLYSLARENGYIAPGTVPPLVSEFDDARGCTIDFTNPRAMEWYKGLLQRLLRMGAAAIKTDFGESIEMQASTTACGARFPWAGSSSVFHACRSSSAAAPRSRS